MPMSLIAVPILSELFIEYATKLSSKQLEIKSRHFFFVKGEHQIETTNQHKFDGVIFYGAFSKQMTAGEVGGATCGIERWRKTP